jgi:dipeptidyl aminopeptidase/acylaminoacyl peptidase
MSTTAISTPAETTDKGYGGWSSPITSKAITAGSVGIASLKLFGSQLYWLESRPQEAGRYVVCRYDPNHADKNERDAVEVTPKDSNVRTRVHEYGGGAYWLGQSSNGDRQLFFSEFSTQRLCQLPLENSGGGPAASSSDVRPLTPETEKVATFRFADGDYDAASGTIYCIREDHTNPAPKDVVNEIVAVDTIAHEEGSTIKVLATGNDFFAAPRVSPDGTKLAYITWNHPDMPWDATELRVAVVNGAEDEKSSPNTQDHILIAGANGDTSILQPQWHPLTGDLYYVSDESGYYNIYRASFLNDASSGIKTVNILPMEFDFGGSAPGWSLGQQGFEILADGRLVATYSKNGISRLVVGNVMDDKDGPATNVQEYSGETQEGVLPMQFGGVIGDDKNNLYFLGGSPSTPASVFRWNLATPQVPATMLACTSTLSFPNHVISVPRQVEFPTTLGDGTATTAFGYYYAPRNGNFTCTTEAAPPLLVKAHGGPTACTGTTFNAGIQYWTSRGFAILDVDYGGSTGYGRDYRRRLRKSWGIVDIDDVCAGAQYLVQEGLADEKRLCIDGGSAGGYTTLGALAFKDVFRAGCSKYGIGDLTALAGDTHKFESRYLDGLVGPYPEDKDIYLKRSPIQSIETLSCPILLLQGDQDKVVPPNQAEMMHKALLEKGIPTCLKMYEGEQHGFRKAENIEDSLDSELAFFGKVFGIDVPDAIDLKIDNL